MQMILSYGNITITDSFFDQFSVHRANMTVETLPRFKHVM